MGNHLKLHENKSDFIEAIRVTANSLKMREVFVEKDYWVCFILKNLSISDFKNEVVFKGGTSLSKAHKVIHRFSEDVDLAIIANDRPDNQIKKLITSVEKEIVKNTLQEIINHELTSKGSRFRKTVWNYGETMSGDYGDASSHLLIEINSFAVPTPYQLGTIQTYIADYFDEKGLLLEKKEYELNSFQVNVLDMKRTFSEKVAALGRASFSSMKDNSELKRKIRHLYDLAMMARQDSIRNFISNGEFKILFQKVKDDDNNISKEQASIVQRDILTAPIFNSTKEVLTSLTSTYLNEFSSLVYAVDKMPDIEEIQKIIEVIKIGLA